MYHQHHCVSLCIKGISAHHLIIITSTGANKRWKGHLPQSTRFCLSAFAYWLAAILLIHIYIYNELCGLFCMVTISRALCLVVTDRVNFTIFFYTSYFLHLLSPTVKKKLFTHVEMMKGWAQLFLFVLSIAISVSRAQLSTSRSLGSRYNHPHNGSILTTVSFA